MRLHRLALPIALCLACGGGLHRGSVERVVIDSWTAPDGTVIDVVAELTAVHRRGGPGIGCHSSEALVMPELRSYDSADLVEPALRLSARGRPGLEDRAIYAPAVPMPTRDHALADARAQVLVRCFSADGSRLAIRWEPPGTDPSQPGLWPWSVMSLRPTAGWLDEVPADQSCAQAAGR